MPFIAMAKRTTEGNKEAFSKVALALEYRGDRLKLEAILDYSDRELRRGNTAFPLKQERHRGALCAGS